MRATCCTPPTRVDRPCRASLALLLVLALSTGAARSQDAPSAPEATPALPPGVLATVDGTPVSEADFATYLGLIHARQELGRLALDQLLVERILAARAEAAAVSVDEAAVDALFAHFDAKARAASGGERGLMESVGGQAQAAVLRETVRLAALQRAVVAAETGADDPLALDDAALKAWLDAAIAEAKLTLLPLFGSDAATWTGGPIRRADLGARVARMLPPDELQGALTELLGILAVDAHAATRGLAFTAEAAFAELAERERLVAEHESAPGLGYAEYLAQVEQLTPEELLQTPRFRAEVLIARIVEQDWEAQDLAALFDELRHADPPRLPADMPLEEALPAVLREARQRAYRAIVASCSIVRR